jgi:tetratricopeptide (TPR) repeat protein
VEALRKAARGAANLEIKRRAEQLADQIDQQALEQPWREGLLQEAKGNYKQAAALFDRVIEKGLKLYHQDKNKVRPVGGVPFLAEAYFHSGRANRKLGEYEKAANAYQWAQYYAPVDTDTRPEIEREWSAMAARLVATWRQAVMARAEKDTSLKALVTKYPLVVLHSRRYADGAYLQSAYSFIDRTADQDKHRNGVQLLFDNGGRQPTFGINMVTTQKNAVAELKGADFNKDPDPEKLAADPKIRWLTYECQARAGEVYLERVQDATGTRFFVLFEVVAVDRDSRYVAFVWRRLPGGKLVPQK